MIQTAAIVASLLSLASQPATTASDASAALRASVATCEQWLLEPATWTGSIDRFPQASGLSDQVSSVEAVPDFALPPADLRRAMHHWRVPVGDDGGMFVTTSDQSPMCHVVGGGPFDLQPAVVAMLAKSDFQAAWTGKGSVKNRGLRTERFESRRDSNLELIVTHAIAAGDRIDRPQFVATAQYRLRK